MRCLLVYIVLLSEVASLHHFSLVYVLERVKKKVGVADEVT